MSERRHEKELKRKRKAEREEKVAPAETAPAPAQAAEKPQPPLAKDIITRELGTPERLLVHLQRLSQLLAMVETLQPARLPVSRLVPELLAIPPEEIAALPEAQRPQKIRERILGKLADPSTARAASIAFDATLSQAREQADRFALLAGKTFIDSWRRTGDKAHLNPAWEAIFGISLLDAIFEGHLLAQIVRDSWKVDEAGAGRAFAKALAKTEVASELEQLGLDERDPQALAKRYAAQARDEGTTFLLGFDAVLHLVRANANFASANVKVLLANGATAEMRTAALEAFDRSYKDDITKRLTDDLANEISRQLQALAKGEAPAPPKAKDEGSPDEAKRASLVALTTLRALPAEENALLRNTYLGSFEIYKTVAPQEELPFIRRVWAEPEDRWALEEYRRFLLERRNAHRADRVRRYLAEIRAEGKPKDGEAPPAAASS